MRYSVKFDLLRSRALAVCQHTQTLAALTPSHAEFLTFSHAQERYVKYDQHAQFKDQMNTYTDEKFNAKLLARRFFHRNIADECWIVCKQAVTYKPELAMRGAKMWGYLTSRWARDSSFQLYRNNAQQKPLSGPIEMDKRT
jgi:hypothetical protein